MSRLQAAFHQHLAPARANQLHRHCGGGLAIGASTSSKPLISILCLRAAALIFAAGPTNVGLMMPASAASAAPRSELSSHGCTTIVVAAGIAFAAAMRRSYFVPGRASPA